MDRLSCVVEYLMGAIRCEKLRAYDMATSRPMIILPPLRPGVRVSVCNTNN